MQSKLRRFFGLLSVNYLARISGRDRRGRAEGTIAEVLARNTQTLVGVFRQELLTVAVDPVPGHVQPQRSNQLILT